MPNLGQIGDVPGKWTLDWGPGITSNFFKWKANRMFVASYRDPASNLPVFTAVASSLGAMAYPPWTFNAGQSPLNQCS